MSIITDLFSTGAKASIGAVLDGANKIITDFKADPTKVAEANEALAELKINAELKSQELSNNLETAYATEIESVNATMREEGKSEKWWVSSWRPTLAYIFGAIMFNNYVLCSYFKFATIIVLPDNLFNTFLVILGASAAGRSIEKWQKAKNDGK